jgi:hypothetical protein
MGRQVTVTLICDVCKKEVDERNSVPGELAANRRRWTLHVHKTCLDSLVKTAERVPRKRRRPGRPKGSTTKRKVT